MFEWLCEDAFCCWMLEVRKGSVADTDEPPRRASEEQLECLVNDYGSLMYKIAVSVVRDQALAEDVVQNVLVKVWRSAPEGVSEVPIGWLSVVTRNAAIDLVRSRRFDVSAPLDDDIVSPSPGPARVVEDREFLDAVWSALAHLDEEARTMLILRETEDMGYAEIAKMLGVTESMVKTELYRARHELRRLTSEWQE